MRATYRYVKSWVWAPKKKEAISEINVVAENQPEVAASFEETAPGAVVEAEQTTLEIKNKEDEEEEEEVCKEASHDLDDVISWLHDLAKHPSPEQKIAISDLMDYIVMYKRLDMLKSPYAARLIQDEILMLAIFHQFYLDSHFETLFSLSLQDVLDGRATIQPVLNGAAKLDLNGAPLSSGEICKTANTYITAVEKLNWFLDSDFKKKRLYQEVILNQLVNLIAEHKPLFQRHRRFVFTFKRKLQEFEAINVKLPWFWRSLF